MSKSPYIRDLIGYIRYCHPDDDALVDSAVISIFDLLYREYSARLRPLAEKVQGTMRYRSEEIAWTLLQGLLAEAAYAHLMVSCQVLLRNLLTDLSRLTPDPPGLARVGQRVEQLHQLARLLDPRIGSIGCWAGHAGGELLGSDGGMRD